MREFLVDEVTRINAKLESVADKEDTFRLDSSLELTSTARDDPNSIVLGPGSRQRAHRTQG